MGESQETPSAERASAAILRRYWRKNLLLMGVLLFWWAFFGIGCGILFADVLNAYTLFGTGYPLGFWFAQQGSIIAFILLILIYAIAMNRIDRTHLVELNALPGMNTKGKDDL